MVSTIPVHIIGGGLAGSEAAWQLAQRGIHVVLHEMRRVGGETPAHHTGQLAELVCSNSFRSDDDTRNAVGLLHWELRHGQSLILACADANRVPAGGALAVDREGFAKAVTSHITQHPLITVVREEVTSLAPFAGKPLLIATGPLTSAALAEEIGRLTGAEYLAFFDAIAPIVTRESVNMDIAWMQSRYDKGDGQDYINCPMDAAQYMRFIEALRAADTASFKDWEQNTPYFEGCLPIEVMAARGMETLRYGPMKPVGLRNPHTNGRPHAVVQLRQDNITGTLYNMVGFQTKLKHGAQKEVFRMIPALEHAVFARLGGIHRNTFINSPALLDEGLCLRNSPQIRFAGQITGVEGYVESTAIGWLAGRFMAAGLQGMPLPIPPAATAMGALHRHITGAACVETFQPMNVNFGLFPPLADKTRKTDRKQALTHRAKALLAA